MRTYKALLLSLLASGLPALAHNVAAKDAELLKQNGMESLREMPPAKPHQNRRLYPVSFPTATPAGPELKSDAP